MANDSRYRYDPDTGKWYEYRPGSGVYSGDTTGSWYEIPGMNMQDPAGDVAPGGKASEMAAGVLREEFKNWWQQYRPVELNLLNQTSFNNPEILKSAVNQAETNATSAADAMTGIENRQMASQGVVATPGQESVISRLNNLSRAQMVSGAKNTARQQVSRQDELIATGSAPNPNPAAQSSLTSYKTM